MSERRSLISTRRRIAPGALGDYDKAWARLASAAGRTNAKAWRFQADGDPRLFVEFLEFGPREDPRKDDEVAAAIRSLDELASGHSEQWLDANS